MLKMLCGLLFYCLQNHFYSNIDIDKQFNFSLPRRYGLPIFIKVQNIVIPEISFLHDQSIKTKYSLPKDSPIGKKEDVELRYGKFIGIHSGIKSGVSDMIREKFYQYLIIELSNF